MPCGLSVAGEAPISQPFPNPSPAPPLRTFSLAPPSTLGRLVDRLPCVRSARCGFFLAIAVTIVVGAVMDADAPALVLPGAGAGGLVLFCRPRGWRSKPPRPPAS